MLSKKEYAPFLICDHYVISDTKSQFIYMANHNELSCLALSKKFMFDKVFPNYPEIFLTMQEESRKYYQKYIFTPVHQDRLQKVQNMNSQSIYKKITLDNKPRRTFFLNPDYLDQTTKVEQISEEGLTKDDLEEELQRIQDRLTGASELVKEAYEKTIQRVNEMEDLFTMAKYM